MLHELSTVDVAVATSLIIVNGAVSIGLKLGLEKRLAIAATRTIVQLALIGFILEWIFRWERWDVFLAQFAVFAIYISLSFPLTS